MAIPLDDDRCQEVSVVRSIARATAGADPEELALCGMRMRAMPYLMGQVIMADGGYR